MLEILGNLSFWLRTFVIFKSVTFEYFLKIMESVGGDANSVFHEDQKIFKSDMFESDAICATFENFGKCSESIGFDANNDLQKSLKIKSDTFENYKTLYPQKFRTIVESRNLSVLFLFPSCQLLVIFTSN